MDSIENLRRRLDYLKADDDTWDQAIAERIIADILEALSELEDRLRAVETSQLELAQETWKP